MRLQGVAIRADRNTIAVRLPDDLAEWLDAASRKAGVPRGRIVRDQLELAREREKQPFLAWLDRSMARVICRPARGSPERDRHRLQHLERHLRAADSGFLVAFANRRDLHHRWAVDVASRVDRALLTCDAVLAETAFHLESSSLVLAMVQEGLVLPQFVVSDHLSRLAELAKRYSDRKPDLADLCLIRISELNPSLPVITTNVGDFQVYRRGRREIIPLLHPS